MKKAKKTQENKKRKSFRWWNLLVVGLALFLCVRLGMQIAEYYELQDEAAYYEQVLADTEEAYQEQLDKQELLYNDAYLERMARERLGMVKAGETVISTVNTDLPEIDEASGEDADEDSEEEQDGESEQAAQTADAAAE